MRIISLHIDGFGTLSKVDYSFNEGLNTICEDNGFGKTTLANFIRVMFYGLKPKKTDLFEKDKERFTPWSNPNVFGGSLQFETDDGKQYEIRRNFLNSKKSFELIDLSTNQLSNDYSENIGETLFNVNEEGFENSFFVSELLVTEKVTGSYSTIQTQLTEAADLDKCQHAIDSIKNKIKDYEKQSANSTLAIQKKQLQELEEKTLKEEAAIEELNIARQKKIELTQQQKKLQEDFDKFQEEYFTNTAVNQSKNLKASMDLAQTRLDEINDRIKDIQEELNNNTKTISELSDVKKTIIHFSNLDAPSSQLEKKNYAFPVSFTIFSAIIMIVGIILSIFSSKDLLIIAAIGLVAFVIGIVLLLKVGSNNILYQKSHLKNEEYYNQKSNIDSFFAFYENIRDNDEYDTYEKKINRIIKLQDDYNTELDNKKTQEEQLERITKAYLENDTNQEVTKQEQEYEDKKREYTEQLAFLSDQLMDVEATIRQSQSISSEMQSDQDLYQSLTNQIALEEQYVYRLKEIISCLENAKRNLTSEYTTPIQNAFRKNINLLFGMKNDSTSDEYETEAYSVTNNFDIMVTKCNNTRSTNTVSKGSRDLLALCLRFAITEAITKQSKPFLILDDPFVNLDDKKVVSSLKLIQNLAKNYQIIYFTCHSSRCPEETRI